MPFIPFSFHLISFSYLSALAWTLSKTLNRSVKGGHCCLILDLMGSVQYFTIKYDVTCGISRCPLSFYHEMVLGFVKCFFCWEDHMVYFLYSVNMIYYIDCVWWYVESLLHFWDKSHSWCKILYICCLLWFCGGLWCPYS